MYYMCIRICMSRLLSVNRYVSLKIVNRDWIRKLEDNGESHLLCRLITRYYKFKCHGHAQSGSWFKNRFIIIFIGISIQRTYIHIVVEKIIIRRSGTRHI